MSKEKEAEKKNIWYRLLNVDRRYIILITIVVFIPLLFPLKIPFTLSDWGVMYYNAIEAVPNGSLVLSTNGGLGIEALDILWSHTVLMDHLLRKNCKIVEANPYGVNSALACDYLWKNLIDKKLLVKVTYGVDYVILPYVAGEVVSWAAIAKDIRSSCGGKDYYGTSLDALPIMKNVNSAADFQFLTETGSHETLNIRPVVFQIQTPYNLPLVVISQGISHATTASFIATGQIKGAVEGLNDYATYELLTGYPGINLMQLDVVSAHHLLVVMLIIIGNIFFVLSERGAKALSKQEVKK